MTTISWIITKLQAATQTIDGFQEVVLSANWQCNGVDGEYSSSIPGSSSFPEPTQGGQFTPYADLTQEQVLGWCWENGVNQTSVEASVTQQVTTLANPPVVNPPLPWVNQAA